MKPLDVARLMPSGQDRRTWLVMEEQITNFCLALISGDWGLKCQYGRSKPTFKSILAGINYYRASRTNPSVPNDDAINSNTLWLSLFCTASSSSSPPFSSSFVINISACRRKNAFIIASTASKSRCVASRRLSACINVLKLRNDVRDRSSSSSAAGCSVLAWWKNPSSGHKINACRRSGTVQHTHNLR